MTSSGRSIVAGVLVLVLALGGTPLLWRVAVNRGAPVAEGTPSYLPSQEAVRVRLPFEDTPVGDLRDLQPGIVIIGDSMAGRVDPDRLGELMETPVAPLLHAASGPGVWYLVFKNYVVASGITPSLTLVFFRDTNLTDLMFRLLDGRRQELDRVAVDLEPELDRVIAARQSGPWYRAHAAVSDLYAVERTRTWLEPALLAWPARVLAGNRGGMLLQREVNDRFELDRLRPMPISDMSVVSENDADFAANVDTSVLPLMLSLAREQCLPLCFVRVQRRSPDGGLRPESPALVRYMRDLRAYIEREGGRLIDDQHDREVSLLPYSDLDHVARDGRRPYAEILARKLKALPR